jgi:hypothetical protein
VRTFVVRRVSIAVVRRKMLSTGEGSVSEKHAHNAGRETHVQHLPRCELEVHLPPLERRASAERGGSQRPTGRAFAILRR